MQDRTVALRGTFTYPQLVIAFHYGARHPEGGSLTDWVKSLPNRTWDPDNFHWVVTGTGIMPEKLLNAAGFSYNATGIVTDAHILDPQDPTKPLRLNDLWQPIARRSIDNPDIVWVRHRFAGYTRCQRIIGAAARWDKKTGLFAMPLYTLVRDGKPLDGLLALDDCVEAAQVLHDQRIHADLEASSSDHAVALAAATGNEEGAAAVVVQTALATAHQQDGTVPENFGLDLWKFQEFGAAAMVSGRWLNCDDMGLGKGSPPETPLLTPTGWTTYGDIKPGDHVVGSNGRPTTVIGVFPRGVLPTYRVTFDDGSVVRCDPEHRWSVVTEHDMTEGASQRDATRVVDTSRLAVLVQLGGPAGIGGISVTNVKPVHFHNRRAITPRAARRIGLALAEPLDRNLLLAHYCGTATPGTIHSDGNARPLPDSVLFSSIEARVELLAASIDSLGKHPLCDHKTTLVCADRPLAESLIHVVRSLGGTATLDARDTNTAVLAGFNHTHTVAITMPACFDQYLNGRARKLLADGELDGLTETTETWPTRHIVDVALDSAGEIICISVDAEDQLYVTNDFVVTHNTRTTIATQAAVGASRLVVVAPPVTVTHWVRELTDSNIAPADSVIAFMAGRKEPALPETGVVVIPDSLLSSRQTLRRRLIDWAPTGLIVDEAHRAKNWDSERSSAVRELARYVTGPRLAATGTPMDESPAELAPLLDITGHLDTVFGGYDNFMQTYCRRNHFNAWVPRATHLRQLRETLDQQVWVRRVKDDVLTDLPEMTRTFTHIDVNLAAFKAAHKDMTDTIAEWVSAHLSDIGTYPDQAAVSAYARGQIGLISPLREAAGLAKVPHAIDLVTQWVETNTRHLRGPRAYGEPLDKRGVLRPLVVWVHHKEVMNALVAGLPDKIKPYAAKLDGAVNAKTRGDIVNSFQRGEVGVLFASIHAAGVGITLTRGSDALFVETDWNPSLVRQGEDRLRRIGQQNHVLTSTLIATGTLDAHIQTVLNRKARVIEKVMGGDVGMSDSTIEQTGPSDVVEQLVHDVINDMRRRVRRESVA